MTPEAQITWWLFTATSVELNPLSLNEFFQGPLSILSERITLSDYLLSFQKAFEILPQDLSYL